MRWLKISKYINIEILYIFLLLMYELLINVPSITSEEIQWQNIAFNISDTMLWKKSNDMYLATGLKDTFIWSEDVIEGDLLFNVTIESNSQKGEGVVVIYGNGVGWSPGCIFFNISNDYQAIRMNTPYEGCKWLSRTNKQMEFINHIYNVTIEILGDKATLYVDGERLLSTFLPSGIMRKGRIGLFKYWERPKVVFSNTQIKTVQKLNTILNKKPEKRVALIIGNTDYSEIPLKNPEHDAEDISQALTALGFTVITKVNLNQQQMENAINAFYLQMKNSDVALFYYSGHGSQIDGENYLIPVGENILSESDIRFKSINIGYVLVKMEESKTKTNIVILDACRNNPYKGYKSLNKGLSVMNAPGGLLLAYATAPDSIAIDGKDRNGIYTKNLLDALKVKGLSIEQLFKMVLRNVEKDSNGKQIPWISSSLREDFYFNP